MEGLHVKQMELSICCAPMKEYVCVCMATVLTQMSLCI